MGDVAVVFGVFRQPGVEENEADVADLDLPDLGKARCPARHFDKRPARRCPWRQEWGHRQVVEIGIAGRSVLLAVASRVWWK